MLQGQTWGSHKLALSLRPIATLIASSSRRSPQDEIDSKCNQSPLCGAAAASNRTQLGSSG